MLYELLLHFRTFPEGIKFASIVESAVNGTSVAVVTLTHADGRRPSFAIGKGNEHGMFRLEAGQNFAILRLNRSADLQNLQQRLKFEVEIIASFVVDFEQSNTSRILEVSFFEWFR
jgi:hypothetical protein